MKKVGQNLKMLETLENKLERTWKNFNKNAFEVDNPLQNPSIFSSTDYPVPRKRPKSGPWVIILNIPNIEHVLDVFSVLSGRIELIPFGAVQVSPDTILNFPNFPKYRSIEIILNGIHNENPDLLPLNTTLTIAVQNVIFQTNRFS